MRTRLPITAFGLCCGLGRDTESAIAELAHGRRGLRAVPFEVPFETVTGTLPGELPALPNPLTIFESRSARLALLAYPEIERAVERAKGRWGPRRIGIVLGTSTGGIDRSEYAHAHWWTHGQADTPLPSDYDYTHQHPFHAMTDMLAAHAAIEGPRYVVSTACSSSAKVLASARRLIELDLVDAVLVGGVDGLCHTTVRGFNSLGVMASEPSRPFGLDRPGMNVGEGAAFLLVEREGDARGWLRGIGETSDAYHMSSPDPEGRGAVGAMRHALEEAGVGAEEVGYVNAHGTGTRHNDTAEARGIQTVFGNDVPVVSTKAYTGHTLGACGALEAIFCLVALEQGWVPAALGAAPTEEGIELHLPAERFEAPLRFALSNAFAFGGNNCSVLLEAP